MGAPVAPQLVGPVLVEQRVVGKRLKPEGWLAVCLLGIVFWPLMCVPCCLPQCQEDVVETVYVSVRALLPAAVKATCCRCQLPSEPLVAAALTPRPFAQPMHAPPMQVVVAPQQHGQQP